MKQTKFRIDDKVRIIDPGPNVRWNTGDIAVVTRDSESDTLTYLRRERDGYEAALFAERLSFVEPQNFKIGDRIIKTGYDHFAQNFGANYGEIEARASTYGVIFKGPVEPFYPHEHWVKWDDNSRSVIHESCISHVTDEESEPVEDSQPDKASYINVDELRHIADICDAFQNFWNVTQANDAPFEIEEGQVFSGVKFYTRSTGELIGTIGVTDDGSFGLYFNE